MTLLGKTEFLPLPLRTDYKELKRILLKYLIEKQVVE